MTDRIPGKYEKLWRARHERDVELSLRHGGHPRFLFFDEPAGARIVQFIEGYCKHHKGEWAGKALLLSSFQREVLTQVFGWKRGDGTRRYRTAYVEIPRKNGKALALDTPIPTPMGWSTMGEIRVGDQVFDEQGCRCTVTGATPVQLGRRCFRVTFSDKTSIVADAEHEWFTEARRNGLPRTGRGLKTSWTRRHIRTTEQIRKTLKYATTGLRVEWNHRVPVCRALSLQDASPLIEPYVLGAWLGNGNSDCAVMNDGVEDLEFVRSQFHRAGFKTTDSSVAGRFGVPGLMRKLRGQGLLGNKHIPETYLRASINERTALAQGLMDSDGTVSKAGQCEFTTTSPRLRDGMLELLRSLGLKPSLDEDRAQLAGKDMGPKYRIQFWCFRDRPMFRFPRHAKRLKPAPARPPRSTHRQIVAVEPVASVAVRCIEVDSPSHLYLAGEGMIPTHNSTIAGGIGLYLEVGDGEAGAEVYSSATKKDQARIVWGDAAAMVKASPELKRFVKVFRNSIVVDRTGSKFEPLGADSNTLDGLNPHGNIVDELHAHKDRGVWDVLDTAMGARRQPLTLAITTAGTYEPEGIGWQMHDYAVKVLEGVIDDDSFFAFIAAADEGDDYFSEMAQRKANPNWGVSVKPDYLAKQAEKAQSQPGFLNEYLRLHLNVWTRTVTRWLSLERWNECEPPAAADARPAALARELSLEKRACFGGLDLSTKLDLSAFVLVFPGEGGFIDVLCRFWLPEQTIATYLKKGQRHYDTWAREGWLTPTAGEVIDYDFIRAEVNALSKRFAVQQIAYDPWGATQLANQLMGDGLVMVECRQGFQSLSEPSKDIEARIIEKKVRHANNPVLRFCVSNAVNRKDPAGNIKPDKEKAVDRIDGVVAMVMALGRCITQPADVGHAYQSGGFKQL